MITVLVNENNPVSQDFYDSVINSLQIHRIFCSCGHAGCLHIHAYYERHLKTPSGRIKLRICRVKCECCGKTHAILPSFIVPYSQISLQDQTAVIQASETGSSMETVMQGNAYIDESNCRHIIRQYRKYWKQKLLSQKISLSPVSSLVSACFHFFFRQFMQIKSTSNILFLNTT